MIITVELYSFLFKNNKILFLLLLLLKEIYSNQVISKSKKVKKK